MTTAVPHRLPTKLETRLCSQIADPRVLLGLGVCVAFSLRLGFAMAPHVAYGDESCYIWLARNLFGGAGYTYYAGKPELHFPPGFPVALGLLHLIIPDWDLVTRAAYVIFGGLLPIPVYCLGREMYSRRAGLLAAGLTATLPAFTSGVLFAETMSEPLYLLLTWTGLALAYAAATRKTFLPAALGGGFLALANLTRSEGQVYFFIALALLGLLGAFRKPRRLLVGLGQLGLCGGVFLLVSFPYMLYLHQHTGKWALDTKSTTSYTTTRALVNKDGAGFQRDTWGLNAEGEVHYYAHPSDRSLVELLRTDYRDRVASDMSSNFRTAMAYLKRPWVCGGWLLRLAALGLAAALIFRRRPGAELLHVMVLSSILPITVFFITERFLYNLLLPVLLWSGCGLDIGITFLRLFTRRRSRQARTLGSVAVLLLVAAIGAYYVHHGYRHLVRRTPSGAEVLAAADWLEKNTPEGATILATNTEVAYHARRNWFPLPVAPLADVVAYGRKHGASYLCLRGRYMDRRPEQKAELFDRPRDLPGLTFLTKFGGTGDESEPRFVVYRIEPPVVSGGENR